MKGSYKKGNVEFNVEPDCEHCGQLEPYTATLSEDGFAPYWCIGCATINNMQLGVSLPKIKERESTLKIQYFKLRIAELEV